MTWKIINSIEIVGDTYVIDIGVHGYVHNSTLTMYFTGFAPAVSLTQTVTAKDFATVELAAAGILEIVGGMWTDDVNDLTNTGNKGYYVPDNLSDNGTISATNSDTNYPIDNLQLTYPDDVWRSSSAVDNTILRVLTEERSVDHFSMAGHNLTDSAKITLTIRDVADVVQGVFHFTVEDQLYGWAVGGWGQDLWAGINTTYPADSVVHFRIPYVVACKEFDVLIQDSTNLDGYFEASLLSLDKSIAPEWNFDWGQDVDIVDPSPKQIDGNSNLIVDPEDAYTKLTFGFSFLADDDAHSFHMMKRIAGVKRNVFINCYPESQSMMSRNSLGVFRLESWDGNKITFADNWVTSLEAREVLFARHDRVATQVTPDVNPIELKIKGASNLYGTPDDITLVRASTDTVVDFEAITRNVKSGEAKFTGARRVENLATGLVTETITVVNTNDYQVTIKGTTGATAVCSGAFTGTLTANGSNRISWNSGTPKATTSTSLTITVTGTLTELLVEDVNGQANQNPSSWVASGTNYGAGVNGVRCYDFQNGNTVGSTGIVTEAQGASIAAGTNDGLLVETDDCQAVWPVGLVNDFVIMFDWTPPGTGTQTMFESGDLRIFYDTLGSVDLDKASQTATKSLTAVAGTTYVIKARVSATSGTDVWVDDVIGTNDSNVVDSAPGTNFQIGARVALTEPINGEMKNIKIVSGDLTDLEVTTLTF